MLDYSKIKRESDEARYAFIVTELDLALTFAEIAESSESAEKTERNSESAKKAYESARRFLRDASLTAEMQASIEEKLDKLAAHLNGVSR